MALDDAPGYAASAEAGSFGFARASGSGSLVTDRASLCGRGRLPARDRDQQLRRPGDKDGYRNLSGRLRGDLASACRMSRSAHRRSRSPAATSSTASIPFTVAHTDTLDNSRNRLDAGRIWARSRQRRLALARPGRRLAARLVEPQLSCRRRAEPHPRHASQSVRRSSSGGFATGPVDASPHRCRRHRARDLPCARHRLRRLHRPGSQRATISRSPPNGEPTPKPITGDVAVRRDIFNRFKDATSASRIAARRARRRLLARRLLCRRHCAADLLRSLRILSRQFRGKSSA